MNICKQQSYLQFHVEQLYRT